ncbi:hypothetical protein chiPu_0004441 [Chiloscyllium punctatum]|uniref:Uncharacterized protein n=1 Tax=Chiloscyllium punctatum TaxID=137246 RepID=A0A401S6M1_CHIPU|nr:hypothetical protein [Chiloscyllium punctatum]
MYKLVALQSFVPCSRKAGIQNHFEKDFTTCVLCLSRAMISGFDLDFYVLQSQLGWAEQLACCSVFCGTS